MLLANQRAALLSSMLEWFLYCHLHLYTLYLCWKLSNSVVTMMTKQDTAVRGGASAVMVRCGCSQSVLQHDIAGAHRQLAVYASSTACLYLGTFYLDYTDRRDHWS